MHETPPYTVAADGLRLTVRLSPGASRDAIVGVAREADGAAVLRVAVRAVPEQGRANDALLALLARAWRLPRSGIRIAAGATGRRKVLHLAGDPDALRCAVEAAVAESGVPDAAKRPRAGSGPR